MGVIRGGVGMSDIDHEFTDEIVCPHCGNEGQDSWECSDEGESVCEECRKGFDFVRNTSVTYSTFKKALTPKEKIR